ncbi:MAG: hypothetical protein Kow0090_03940 [Myxococcota bacterium]
MCQPKRAIVFWAVFVAVILLAGGAGYYAAVNIERIKSFISPLPPPKLIIVDESKGEKGLLSVFIGGDTLLGDAAKKTLEKFGYEYPFAEIGEIIEKADIGAANLEAPICDNAPILSKPKQYKYKMPGKVVPILKEAGFDLFFLANNHLTDYTHAGLLETIEFLDKADIAAIGAGRNEAEARRGAIIRKGDIVLGVLNYMSYNKHYEEDYDHFADENQSGVAVLTPKGVRRDVKALRKEGAKIILASVHWGSNYAPVDKKQRREARYMAKAGVDVIVGHGSHDWQEFEMVDGVPVFFSVGNLAFGTPGRPHFKWGFPVTLYFSAGGLKKAEIHPVVTQNRIAKFKPRLLRGEDAENALTEFKNRSNFGKFEMGFEGGEGVVKF